LPYVRQPESICLCDSCNRIEEMSAHSEARVRARMRCRASSSITKAKMPADAAGMGGEVRLEE